jgi:hypothetical protein
MFLQTFTAIHVAISLIGIASGFVVVFGLIASKRLDRWTAVFLTTTVLTSVTGFMFPFHGFLPSYGVALVSLIVLAPAIYGRYKRQMAGHWRRTYVITAVTALYLNVFVLIVQMFMKVPALKALAPTQTELPFKIAQATALTVFIVLGITAAIKFREKPARIERQTSAAA